MGIIFILGLVLLSILFLVFVILSAKTWHWLHVVACFFAYSMAVFSVVMLALTGKTVNAWKQVHKENEEKVAALEEDLRSDTVGLDADINFGAGTVINLSNSLERETYGRGRVWRECEATNVPQDWSSVEVSTIPGWVPEEQQADYPENRLVAGTIVYLFSEREYVDADDPNRYRLPIEFDNATPGTVSPTQFRPFMVPAAYLGEFRVTNAEPHSVTMAPLRFGGTAAEYNAARTGTFVLYEVLPIDRRDAFDDLLEQFDSQNIDESNVNYDQLLARRDMIEEIFRAGGTPFPEGTAEFESLVDRYAFDNLTFTIIQELIERQTDRISPTFDPTPEETWIKVEFIVAGSHQVDLANEALESADPDDPPPTGLERRDFDDNGRAVVRSLRQGGRDSEYKVGDQLVVDQLSAQEGYTDLNGNNIEPLIPSKAKLVAQVYRRTMTDYEWLFHHTDIRLQMIESQMTRVARDILFLNDLYQNSLDQTADWEALHARLTEDKNNFQNDVTTAQDYRAYLESELANKQLTFNQLYALNLQMAATKAEIQAALTEMIDQRSEEAIDGGADTTDGDSN